MVWLAYSLTKKTCLMTTFPYKLMTRAKCWVFQCFCKVSILIFSKVHFIFHNGISIFFKKNVGYIPDLNQLPMFVLRVATNVDWEEEESCFDTFSKELALFYRVHKVCNNHIPYLQN